MINAGDADFNQWASTHTVGNASTLRADFDDFNLVSGTGIDWTDVGFVRISMGRAPAADGSYTYEIRELRTVGGCPDAALRISRPAAGRTYARGPMTLAGDLDAAAGPLSVTLVRRHRGRCRAFDGRRFRRSSCATRRAFAARAGRAGWRVRLPARLRRGVYRLTVRMPVGDRMFPLVKRVRFRVR